MKRILLFLGCLIFGLVLGCSLSWLGVSGAFTSWQPIDDFPYPVQEILAMDQTGGRFWVETKNNEIFQITQPCPVPPLSKTCWTKVDNAPSDISAPYLGEFNISYKESECGNFLNPLFQKITMCITATYFIAPDASESASVALTKNGKLWTSYQPAVGLYTLFYKSILLTSIGGIIGIALGIFLIRKRR